VSGPLIAAALLVAVACVASGVVMLHARVAVASAAALVAAGATGAVAAWLLADGQAPGPGGAVAVVAGLVLAPAALWAYPRLPSSPLGRLGAVLVVVPGLVTIAVSRRPADVATAAFVVVVVLVAVTWWRLERVPSERGPLLWSSLGVATCGLLGLLLMFLSDGGGQGDRVAAAAVAVQAAVPVALAVGVVRPAAIDIRRLVVRVAVAGVVATGYLAAFVGVAAVADLAGLTPAAPVFAVLGLVCAAGVRPAAVVLGGVVDRLLFGDRPDPIMAATRVAARLGDDPVLALDVVREALAVPWVALRRTDGATLAASGDEVETVYVVPLPAPVATDAPDDEPPPVLLVGLRPGDLRMPTADRRVVGLVAPLLAQILRAQALTAAVQASRGQVVAAVEDERRRLRRDLHDGLGPTLTGVAFSVDAARNTVRDDPAAAARLLDTIRADTVDAIGHIRRIVYGMRPPALDELGLLGALAHQARGLRAADGGVLAVTVEADGDLPDLGAAVEVAAYRIVVEALTNVARHAGAAKARVRLSGRPTTPGAPAALVVEVVDDGPGGRPWAAGVGLASVRERAAEVNGTAECGPTPSGGRVFADAAAVSRRPGPGRECPWPAGGWTSGTLDEAPVHVPRTRRGRPGGTPPRSGTSEERHPPGVPGDRGDVHLRRTVHHAQHGEGRSHPRRRLQPVPPLLHRQAEDPGHRRPRGPVPAALREEAGQQLASPRRRCATADHGTAVPVRGATPAPPAFARRVRGLRAACPHQVNAALREDDHGRPERRPRGPVARAGRRAAARRTRRPRGQARRPRRARRCRARPHARAPVRRADRCRRGAPAVVGRRSGRRGRA
jgi:signal transduction histidine kinase